MGLSRTTRIVFATTAALLMLVAGFALTGSATEGEYSYPERQAGDTVDYDGRTMTQMQITPWKDMEGRWHAADGIQVYAGHATANGHRIDAYHYSFLDDDGAPLAASRGGSTSARASSSGVSASSLTVATTFVHPGEAFHPCGWVNSLQGRPGSEMIAYGDCLPGRDRVTLTPTRSDAWQGSQVIVFEADGVELWMRHDLPYPVRIVTDSTIDMAGVRLGGEALAGVELPEDAPMPAPQITDDDTVALFDHLDVSLADVMQALEAGSETYRDWMAAHPEAEITMAETTIDDGVRWQIRIADAETSLRASYTRQPNGAEPVLIELGIEEEWETRVSASESPSGWFADPSSWGTDVPTLQSAVAAWQSYMDTDLEPTILGYAAPSCSPGCGREVYAGHLEIESPPEPGPLDLDPTTEMTRAQGRVLHISPEKTYVEWIRAESSSGPGFLAAPDAAPASEPTPAPGWVPPAPSTVVGVGIGAVLVGFFAWLSTGAKGLPALMLWSRKTRENPSRSKIRRLIEAQPGIHYQAIIQTTGMGNGAVEHHLRRLVDDRSVVAHRTNGYTCYFVPGIERQKMAEAALTKSDGARKVMDAIRQAPGAAVADVTEETGLSPGTVSHHLKKLREVGLVESWRDGRSVRLRAA